MSVFDLDDGDKITIASVFRGSPLLRVTIYEADTGERARTWVNADQAEVLAQALLARVAEVRQVLKAASEPHLGCACPLEGCANCHRDFAGETEPCRCGCGAP